MNVLKRHFPLLRCRSEVMDDIKSNPVLSAMFDTWTDIQQETFLDYCTGERGLKICYDPYFKEIFNVEYDTSRLNDLLSSIMGENVEIITVLPNEGARIASESTLLVTDILVRLESGSLVNVEIQKIGYAFPGERASCYSADLLLREYKRLRDKNKKHFRYSDVMPVYTIVIFEQSPKELKNAKDYYIHKSQTTFDSGIKINLLQKFIFISLDNFKNILQNRIETAHNSSSDGELSDNILSGDELLYSRLEEWLMFLSVDEPELIEFLIRYRPYFKSLYSDIYEMCLNTERLMNMYSEILAELDHNTVVYMMDEMKAEIDEMNEAIAKKDKSIAEKDKSIAEKDKSIAEKDAEIKRLLKLLNQNH